MNKVCCKCRETKDITSFHQAKTRKDGLHPVCKLCRKIEHAEYYIRNKKRVILRTQKSRQRTNKIVLEYLQTHPCIDCGEKDIRCLDFDHVRGTKEACIAELRGAATKTIIDEISKCEVRCANCHRKKTFKNSYRGII